LIAQPAFTFVFSNWTENASIVGTNRLLDGVATSERTFSANFTEDLNGHTVQISTLPAGINVSGAQHYLTGDTANFSAPATVVIGGIPYSFSAFKQEGVVVSVNANFAKPFSTSDPASLEYVVEYLPTNPFPLIRSAVANYTSPIPAVTDLRFSITFDRSIRLTPATTIQITNPSAVRRWYLPRAHFPRPGWDWTRSLFE